MLSKADDYPIHQSPEPIAYAGQSRNFYDRYFFNGYDVDGDVFFALGMGVYPHVDVIDAGFSLIRNGVQHDLLCSRALGMERMDTQVGSIRVEVIEPLQSLRLRIDAPEHGIEADLLFRGRAPAQEEPRFTRRLGSQLFMDYTRLTQNGCWEGWIKHQGERLEVAPLRWLGTRDRSWGIRPIGERDVQANPSAEPFQQFYWLWAPINWDDAVTLYHLNDDEFGDPWNTAGAFVPLHGQGETEVMAQVASHIDFIPGTRHAKEIQIQWQRRRGAGEVTITMKPKFHWYMKGVGYGHETFGHGRYHGGPASTYEEHKLDEVDDAHTLHIQAISETHMTGSLGERRGHGVLEQLIIGPHKPSGFVELMDMAK